MLKYYISVETWRNGYWNNELDHIFKGHWWTFGKWQADSVDVVKVTNALGFQGTFQWDNCAINARD